MSQFISPTPIAYDAIDFSWIVGRVVINVTLVEPLPWGFDFGESEWLTVECLWRIVQNGSVLLTSEDHGQQFGLPAPIDAAQRARETLLNLPVIDVHVRRETADVRISFAEDLCLEIIPTSSGYESWQSQGPGGRCYVAQGGGQICTWMQ